MRTIYCTLIAGAMMSAHGAALAQADQNNGFTEIAAGRFDAAEQVIVQERKMFRHDPDLMLNLAFVYARTGRTAQARALYAEVLQLPDEAMSRAGQRDAGSHAIATAGLSALEAVRLSAR